MRQAQVAGAAVGAFTCYDLETAEGVLSAAEACDAPVVLLVSARSLAARSGQPLLLGLGSMVATSPIAACVQLDHLTALPDEQERWWPQAGALMIDGSSLPLPHNIALTRSAARLLAGSETEIEGEVGRLEGHEDRAQHEGVSTFTQPAEAAHFVSSTGACCVAVSVGNRHGPYPSPPALDWTLLAELVTAVNVPIALHGASGLNREDIGRAVGTGVRKVNFNADLRSAYLEALSLRLAEATRTLDLLALKQAASAAVHNVVLDKLSALGWQ